jgi:hypothetical protein
VTDAEIQKKWLTEADLADIELDVRVLFGGFDSNIEGRVRGAVYGVASALERSGSDLGCWLVRGARLVDEDGYMNQVRFPAPSSAPTSSMEILGQARRSIVDTMQRVVAQQQADGEAVPDFTVVSRWLTVTPYTLLRFRDYVLGQAADAAKSAVDDMLDGSDDGQSVAKVTRAAQARWIAAWLRDGKIL